MIIVHLHTLLQHHTPDGRISLIEIPWTPGMDVAALIGCTRIKLDTENTLLVVNGTIRDLTFPLNDGDEVHLIPAISGGCW